MRILLPILVPLVCLLAVPLMPQHTAPLLAALGASVLTIGLSAPALLARRSAAGSPVRRIAQASSIPSVDGRMWAWRLGLALEVGLVGWTFTSLAALVIAPEQAATWSIHLGLSMLALMLATPALLFLQPDRTSRATPSATTADSTRDAVTKEEEPPSFVPEANQQIQRSHRPSASRHGDMSGDGASASSTPPDMQPLTESRSHHENRSSPSQKGPDTAAIWAHWPDEDESPTAQARSGQSDASKDDEPRSLWSFSDDENAFGNSYDDTPDPQREARVAADVAHTTWSDDNDDESMAWDILDRILEEEESDAKEPDSSWEPDEWPDFNYDV